MVLERKVRHWWTLVDRHRRHVDHEGRRVVGGGPWHQERPVRGASGRWQGGGWYCSCALGDGGLVVVRLGMFGGGAVFL